MGTQNSDGVRRAIRLRIFSGLGCWPKKQIFITGLKEMPQ